MEQKKQEPIRDARQLGTVKMLILGLQHMFAMFGATIIVPILVSGYFHKACGEPLTRGLSVSVTLFCAGFGTLIFHLCTKFKVPAFLGSLFAFLGGFYTVANLDSGMYADMAVNDKAAYACGGIFVAGMGGGYDHLPQRRVFHEVFKGDSEAAGGGSERLHAGGHRGWADSGLPGTLHRHCGLLQTAVQGSVGTRL